VTKNTQNICRQWNTLHQQRCQTESTLVSSFWRCQKAKTGNACLVYYTVRDALIADESKQKGLHVTFEMQLTGRK